MIEDNPKDHIESYFKLEDQERNLSVYDLSCCDLENFISGKLHLKQKNSNSENIFDITKRFKENINGLLFGLREKSDAKMLLIQRLRNTIEESFSVQKVDVQGNEANTRV